MAAQTIIVGDTAQPWPSRRAGWYAVAVLLLAYTVAYVDRAVLTNLVEPIQRDLHIDDTQIGLLHGFAFVIFYVSLGIPLGMMADRRNRKWLICVSIGVWSLMTAACGLARTFTQLFVARIGVGVGEAGLSPGSYSLISDYFPPKARTAALGVYGIAIYIGSGLAILAGGLLVGLIGGRANVTIPVFGAVRAWQMVFFVIGLPGLLVALLAITVREPPRRLEALEIATQSSGREWSRIVLQIRLNLAAYGLHAIGFSFLGVPFNVALLWARPYLTRRFHESPQHGAFIVGWLMLACATSGIMTGSYLADRWQGAGKRDATIRVAIIAACALIPTIAIFPFLPTIFATAAVLGLWLFFGAFAYGAAPSSLQLMTPNRMRASISAIYLVIVNLVGLTMGPTLAGSLTDFVFRDPLAVGYSMSVVSGGATVIALLAFIGVRKPFIRAVTNRLVPITATEAA